MQAAGATCCGTISSPVSSQHRTTTSHTALPPAPLAPTDNYYNRLHTQPLSEYLRESQVQVFHSIPGLISVQKKTWWCREYYYYYCMFIGYYWADRLNSQYSLSSLYQLQFSNNLIAFAEREKNWNLPTMTCRQLQYISIFTST